MQARQVVQEVMQARLDSDRAMQGGGSNASVSILHSLKTALSTTTSSSALQPILHQSQGTSRKGASETKLTTYSEPVWRSAFQCAHFMLHFLLHPGSFFLSSLYFAFIFPGNQKQKLDSSWQSKETHEQHLSSSFCLQRFRTSILHHLGMQALSYPQTVLVPLHQNA